MDIVERLREGKSAGGYWREKEAADEIERLREALRLMPKTIVEAADEIERLRKELADLLADVKACSCKQRENEINQLFEELSK